MILQVMDVESTDRMLTTKQAAAVLKVSESAVNGYVHRKLLKPCKERIGNTNCFLESEVKRFIGVRRGPGNPNFVRRKARKKR